MCLPVAVMTKDKMLSCEHKSSGNSVFLKTTVASSNLGKSSTFSPYVVHSRYFIIYNLNLEFLIKLFVMKYHEKLFLTHQSSSN